MKVRAEDTECGSKECMSFGEWLACLGFLIQNQDEKYSVHLFAYEWGRHKLRLVPFLKILFGKNMEKNMPLSECIYGLKCIMLHSEGLNRFERD